MLSLSWLLVGWLIAVGLFLIFALLTLGINLKYGVSNFTTYAMSALFVGVSVFVLLMTASYISTVDWSQGITMTPSFLSNTPIQY